MASHAPRLLALNLPAAFLALSLWAPSVHAQTATSVAVDGRRSLPLFPTTSWKDGFFLEHSAIPDLGIHPRVSAAYIQSPFGAQQQIDNRLALYVGGVLSIVKYVDFGVVLPIAVWQSGSGTNLTTSAMQRVQLLRSGGGHEPMLAAARLCVDDPTQIIDAVRA